MLFCVCYRLYCTDCKDEGHFNIECKEFKKFKDQKDLQVNKISSNHWIKKNTKQCPKCSTYIQRNEGCLHMTCSNCKYEFCWNCLVFWPDHESTSFYDCQLPSTKKVVATKKKNSKKKKEIEKEEVVLTSIINDKTIESLFNIEKETSKISLFINQIINECGKEKIFFKKLINTLEVIILVFHALKTAVILGFLSKLEDNILKDCHFQLNYVTTSNLLEKIISLYKEYDETEDEDSLLLFNSKIDGFHLNALNKLRRIGFFVN